MPISWYINRLKTMSLPEIGFRARQFLQKSREKKTKQNYFPSDKKLLSLPKQILPIGDFTFDLNGQYIDIFGQDFHFNKTIDWHLDISSGKRFPKTFAKDINIRTEEYGSAKHVWEVNRMQFLTLIALQYRKTSNDELLLQFQDILQSWITDNPYLVGVNWYSNIEVNIRLIVWYFCWEILDVNAIAEKNQEFNDFVYDEWIPCIYLHMQYSAANPSRYSSANNHLISEYAGLFIASCFWQFEETDGWRKNAQQGLEKEILTQHSDAGVNKEEAAEYIQFITDFFLLPLVVGEKAGYNFSEQYNKQLENICDYIYNMMDLNSNIVYYGDEDDGKVLLLDDDLHHDNFKSILTSGVILYGNAKWKNQACGFDTKNAILFGKKGEEEFNNTVEDNLDTASRYYMDEGHFILRSQDRKLGKEIFLHFDAAPLGFLSIAAHGHADALSFVLHIDGHPIITDAGTYTYHTEAEWRQYFLSTMAHNTICIDGQNQATVAGPTMWLNHYKCQVLTQEKTADTDTVTASHNGYENLGLTHQRRVSLNKKVEEVSLIDNLISKGATKHEASIPFHLHPSVEVTQESGNVYLLSHPNARSVRVTLPENTVSKLVFGSTEPIMGWYSESFQKKQPTHVLLAECAFSHNTELHTLLEVLG